jgi:ABC-type sugar transport system ATPase subunit
MDIEIDGLLVERGGRRVLDVPALRFRAKQTTAILGPNGAGKTTLLRAIAGLERSIEGRISIGGSPAQPHGLDVAYVFQEEVFLRRSVRENLELGLCLRRIDKRDARRRVDDALRVFGVPTLADRRADRLSGGEGRRVSLARAFCLRAPLVMLDEPLAGLDRPSYTRLLDELPSLLAAFDATAIVVTHSTDEALRLAEDVVVLVNGRVQASGPKHDVATNPRTEDVARVLGYTVLPVAGGRVAVPPGCLIAGAGAVAFTMEIDGCLDLVTHREMVGRIGDVRVRVELPSSDSAPCAGERVTVHAARCYPVT